MEKFDFAIIGAGVIGCALARRLAGRGCTVALLDRSAPGAEASHAAAGMLAPSAEAESPSPLFALALHSRRLYPALVAELIDETGIDPHYRREGTLLPFASAQQRKSLREALHWQCAHGVAIEEYSAAQLHQAEPGLSGDDVAGAFHLADDHQIDNRLLMQALVRSCQMRGVKMYLGQPVLRVVTREAARGGAGAAAIGVQIGPSAAPRTITAGNVINASGAWAAQIVGTGIPALPIRPVKGHMLALRGPGSALRHVVRTPEVYLIPRRDGRIIIGSTMEEAGFDKAVHAAPLAGLLNAALRLCPALAVAEWQEAWTGLRPASPDGLPVIGPVPGVPAYWTALGHFRNGILLAPATADALTAWLLDGQPPLDLSAFSPARFL